jgi:co-chaperonin GroES (HSP10)
MSEIICDVEPVNNQIVFRFIEDTTQGKFNQQSSGGILVVVKADKQLEDARWVRVLAIGPEADVDFGVGDVVLIQNLRWTNMFSFEDREFWITTDNEVLAVLPDESNPPGEIKNFL